MSKIIPLVIRKEQNTVKQVKVELHVYGNKISCLSGKINQLKIEQKIFSHVLNKSLKPAQLVNVHCAVRKLNADVESLKSEIAKAKSRQSELGNQLSISENKVDKLQTNVNLKKLYEADKKEQSDIDELSALSRFGYRHQHEAEFLCGVVPNTLRTDVVATSKNVANSNASIIDASIHGTLKLNESQSVSVNIDANNNLNCEVMITATKGVTEALIHSSRQQLKKQVDKQGLHVTSFQVQGLK